MFSCFHLSFYRFLIDCLDCLLFHVHETSGHADTKDQHTRLTILIRLSLPFSSQCTTEEAGGTAGRQPVFLTGDWLCCTVSVVLYAAEPLRCDLGLFAMRGAYACAAVLGLGRDVPCLLEVCWFWVEWGWFEAIGWAGMGGVCW